MDLFEKINRSFGTWYEGLFGGGDDVRPKDVLRRILAALEDNRKEGFDNRVYVPNQYVLEIAIHDEEEKDYLLSFLDRDELEAAVKRYCQQNNYHIRGALDFTVREVDEPEVATTGSRIDKVRVRCRYNTKITSPEYVIATAPPTAPVTEDRTVANIRREEPSVSEDGTIMAVPKAVLVVYAPDRPPFRFPVSAVGVTIGRSAKVGNDLVVDTDGQVSKSHARVERDADGRFTLYDLESTNGTKVNGRRISNRTLNDGDEITLGNTRILFNMPAAQNENVTGRGAAAPTHAPGAFGGAAEHLNSAPAKTDPMQRARLILIDGSNMVDDYLLASETLIGRGVTNDIVLPDRTVATRHARIFCDGTGYRVEGLTDSSVTRLNDEALTPNTVIPLRNGDRLTLGDLTFRFEYGG
jgi:pSer/pThr/pTyr-binding forkhead associated (FHA) protein